MYLSLFIYLFYLTEDLWAHLAQASNKPVGEVMSCWTKQLGYPVLSVEGKQVEMIHIVLRAACIKCLYQFLLTIGPSND